jgi:hypothetical protein
MSYMMGNERPQNPQKFPNFYQALQETIMCHDNMSLEVKAKII